MKKQNKWTLTVDSDIEERAREHCEEYNITFQDYANQRLDPDCPRRFGVNMENGICVPSSDQTMPNIEDYSKKSIEELVEILVEKRIKEKLISEIIKA